MENTSYVVDTIKVKLASDKEPQIEIMVKVHHSPMIAGERIPGPNLEELLSEIEMIQDAFGIVTTSSLVDE